MVKIVTMPVFMDKDFNEQYTVSTHDGVCTYYKRLRLGNNFTPWEPITKHNFYKKVTKIIRNSLSEV